MPATVLRILFLVLLQSVCLQRCLYAQGFEKVNLSEIQVQHPKVSYDGSQMVFMANYDGRLKPYISVRDGNGGWGDPVAVFDQEVSGKYFFEYPQLNFDNSKLYLAARSLESNWDIYSSELIDGKWAEPMPLEIEGLNTPSIETAPAMSPNEKILLFTRPVLGEEDGICQEIWISNKEETGEWTKPTVLSPDYNTGCVCSPYFGVDSKTFYFSSSQDILDAAGQAVSKKVFNVFWAKIDGQFYFTPVPVNSLIGEEDKVSFSLDPSGTSYFGQGDIFKSNEKRRYSQLLSSGVDQTLSPEKSTMIKGQISDLSDQVLEAEIVVLNPYTFKVLQKVRSDEKGYFQLFVPAGGEYSVLAKKENYSTQSKLMRVDSAGVMPVDFRLFRNVKMKFNVFDDEFFFPIEATAKLYDANFSLLDQHQIGREQEEGVEVSLGKKLFVVFESENYLPDTLRLPLDEEIIFNEFEFDIELTRKLKDLSLTFSDEATGNSLGLEVTVYNVTRNEKTKRSVKDGKLKLELRDGEVYEISTSAQGYSYFSATFDMSEEQPAGVEQKVEAKLKSVKNTSIVLGNIIFEYNSYELTAASYSEADKLVDYLLENENYRVEISAHTDDSGADAYNLKLSRFRANSVKEYLEDHGIDGQRLIAKGYGESRPLVPNNGEENMAKNRRVEFKILDEDE